MAAAEYPLEALRKLREERAEAQVTAGGTGGEDHAAEAECWSGAGTREQAVRAEREHARRAGAARGGQVSGADLLRAR